MNLDIMDTRRGHNVSVDEPAHLALSARDISGPPVRSSASEEGRLTGRKLGMLLCCSGAPFLIMLDSNIVAVSLPAIARNLHGKFTDVEWVVSAYILPFAALLVPAGALADMLGRRRVLLIGLFVFTLASVLCGLALNLPVLNAARALQAVGAALQLSSSMAVIAHGFEPNERRRAYAIWGTVLGFAPSLGPVVGGLVTSYFGWRWAFLINLPIGVALIALVFASVDESRDPDAQRLDLLGIALFGTGLFCVVWALIGGNNSGWTGAPTLTKLMVGGALLLGFVLAERTHPRPMLDLTLFRNKVFVGAATAMLGYAASAQVMMTLLPLYLQDSLGQSPATAGLAMIPFALPLLIGPSVGGKLAQRMTSRSILTTALIMVGFGDAIIACAIFIRPGYSTVVIGMIITGSGAGLLNSETAKAQIGAVPSERAGMASGIASATRFVGLILGLAVLGAVLAEVSESNLRRMGTSALPGLKLDWHAFSQKIVGGDASGAISSLPVRVQDVAEQLVHSSVVYGFGAALATGAVIALSSSLICWQLLRD